MGIFRWRRKKALRYQHLHQGEEVVAALPSRPPTRHRFEVLRLLFLDSGVLMTALCYALLGFSTSVFLQIFPLWLLASERVGGLGFMSNQIGIINSVSGIYVIFFQLFLNPIISKALGLLGVFRVGIFVMAICSVLIPQTSAWFSAQSWVIWIPLVLVVLVRASATQLAFTASMRLVNNSARPDSKGLINGFAQSFASLLRSVGPFIGTSVFAWSLTNGLTWPLDHRFVFYIVAGMTVVVMTVALLLPRRLNSTPRQG